MVDARATVAYPDTCVGTDSHTTMINGLGVLGWGVGGIEAEAAMLGQPVSMLIPEVVGFKLTGSHLNEGITATDLVLTCDRNCCANMAWLAALSNIIGPGLASLTLADRATLANMAPEYGATCGFFGIDDKTLDYMRLTGPFEEDADCAGRGLCQGAGFLDRSRRWSRCSARRSNSIMGTVVQPSPRGAEAAAGQVLSLHAGR